MKFHLAELNIARLHVPLGHPDNDEFTSVLAAVNQIAEVSPGFVWRLKDENGNSSSYVEVFDDPKLIVNLSVWETVEQLRHYVYRSGHGAYFRRAHEWFEKAATTDLVCWWIPAGTVPTPEEAVERLTYLRSNGSTPHAFALSAPQPQPKH